jgi:hypothetical protein
MFVMNVVLHYRDNHRNIREKEELTTELTNVKAKMYDIQEGKKTPDQA